MGTSTPFKGPSGSTPLLPSWLAEPTVPAPAALPGEAPDAMPAGADPADEVPVAPVDEASPDALKYRFRGPRIQFSRFVSSDGVDRVALSRACSGYVSKAMGGPRNAALRMGSARQAVARFVGVLNAFQDAGVDATLRSLDLAALRGRPLREIMGALTDHICPPGGSIEEAIPRDAYCDVISDLEAMGVDDLGALTDDHIESLTATMVERTVVSRVINDIGKRLYQHPEAPALNQVLRDFVHGLVADHIRPLIHEARALPAKDLDAAILRVYERAFRLMQGETE